MSSGPLVCLPGGNTHAWHMVDTQALLLSVRVGLHAEVTEEVTGWPPPWASASPFWGVGEGRGLPWRQHCIQQGSLGQASPTQGCATRGLMRCWTVAEEGEAKVGRVGRDGLGGEQPLGEGGWLWRYKYLPGNRTRK